MSFISDDQGRQVELHGVISSLARGDRRPRNAYTPPEYSRSPSYAITSTSLTSQNLFFELQIRPPFFERCERAELPVAKFDGLIHIQVRAKR